MRKAVVALAILAASAAVPAGATPPSNDSVADATVVGALPFDVISNDVAHATTEAGEPAGCFGPTKTIWYRYTAPVDQDLIADTHVSGTSNKMALYSGAGLAELTFHACAGSNGYNGARIPFRASAGTTYWFQISSMSAWSWFTGFYLVADRPANDDRGAAQVISSLPFETTEQTLGATHESDDQGCYESGWYGRGVWFRWTADAPGLVVADAAGTDYRAIISVFSGPAFVGCSGYGDAFNPSFSFQSEAGRTYLFHIHNNSRQIGTLRFGLRMLPPPNDDFARAWFLPSGYPLVAGLGTTLASTEAGEPQSCAGIGATIWWRYRPSATERLVADVTGSDFPAVIAVYEGSSLDGLVERGCGAGGWLDVAVEAGRTYSVQVGGIGGATGSARLRVGVVRNAPYQGIFGGLPIKCGRRSATACIDIPGGSTVDVAIADRRADPVSAGYRFVDLSPYYGERVLETGTFCGSMTGHAVPPGASRLEIFAGATTIETGCGDGLPGTGGVATATFWPN